MSRRKEIKKIKAEINEIERKKTVEKKKSWLFEKINEINKFLDRLIK